MLTLQTTSSWRRLTLKQTGTTENWKRGDDANWSASETPKRTLLAARERESSPNQPTTTTPEPKNIQTLPLPTPHRRRTTTVRVKEDHHRNKDLDKTKGNNLVKIHPEGGGRQDSPSKTHLQGEVNIYLPQSGRAPHEMTNTNHRTPPAIELFHPTVMENEAMITVDERSTVDPNTVTGAGPTIARDVTSDTRTTVNPDSPKGTGLVNARCITTGHMNVTAADTSHKDSRRNVHSKVASNHHLTTPDLDPNDNIPMFSTPHHSSCNLFRVRGRPPSWYLPR